MDGCELPLVLGNAFVVQFRRILAVLWIIMKVSQMLTSCFNLGRISHYTMDVGWFGSIHCDSTGTGGVRRWVAKFIILRYIYWFMFNRWMTRNSQVLLLSHTEPSRMKMNPMPWTSLQKISERSRSSRAPPRMSTDDTRQIDANADYPRFSSAARWLQRPSYIFIGNSCRPYGVGVTFAFNLLYWQTH